MGIYVNTERRPLRPTDKYSNRWIFKGMVLKRFSSVVWWRSVARMQKARFVKYVWTEYMRIYVIATNFEAHKEHLRTATRNT